MPGDVGIRAGTPTGQTGSHVTFVESVNPAKGTFIGFGGNQSSFRSEYSLSDYDFRVGHAGSANLEMARAATGGGTARVTQGGRGRGGSGGTPYGMPGTGGRPYPMPGSGGISNWLSSYATRRASAATSGGSGSATSAGIMPQSVESLIASVNPKYRETAKSMWATLMSDRAMQLRAAAYPFAASNVGGPMTMVAGQKSVMGSEWLSQKSGGKYKSWGDYNAAQKSKKRTGSW